MAAWDNDPIVQPKIEMPWDNDPIVATATAGQSDVSSKPWESDPVATPTVTEDKPVDDSQHSFSDIAKTNSSPFGEAYMGQIKEVSNSLTDTFTKPLDTSNPIATVGDIGSRAVGVGSDIFKTALAAPEATLETKVMPAVADKALPFLQKEFPANFPALSPEDQEKAKGMFSKMGAETLTNTAAMAAGGAEAPKLGKAPVATVTKTPLTDILNNATARTQDDALANLSMSAKQPWKKTEDMAQDVKNTIVPHRSIEEIDADIKDMAANTAGIGVKERLSLLQQEKADALNPQSTVDKYARTTNGEITDEQFHANIKQPTDAALASGVPVERIRAELEASIPQSFDDAYRKQLIDRAIPQSAKNIEAASPEIATATGIKPADVQGVTLPNTLDVTTPNTVREAMDNIDKPLHVDVPNLGLNAEQTEKVLGQEGSFKQKFKSVYNGTFNEYTIMDNLNRAWSKLNGINIGRNDLLELSDTALEKNISQRGGYSYQTYLGDLAGENRSIYRIQEGTSELKEDPSIMPYNTIKQDAIKAGLDSESLNKINLARNALDDYANLDRAAQDSVRQIADNEKTIYTLRKQKELAENQSFFNARSLTNKIEVLNNENKAHNKLISELGKRQTYMSKEDAIATQAQFKGNPAAQTYIDNLNNLHGALLDDLVVAGKITPELAKKLKETHPNYIPAYRTVDDYTVNMAQQRGYAGGAQKPFQRREIGKRGAEQVDPEGNIVRNIVSNIKKRDAAQLRGVMLNNLLKILGDDGWGLVFRESKADVLKAIAKLQESKKSVIVDDRIVWRKANRTATGIETRQLHDGTWQIKYDAPNNIQGFTAQDITKADPNRIENYNHIVFDIKGKQLQLSVKDENLFKSLAHEYLQYDPKSLALKSQLFISRMKRAGIITLDPTFPFRNAERGVMDFLVNSRRVTPFVDYIPGLSQVKTVAGTFFDTQFYENYSMNYGFGNMLSKSYELKSTDKIVDMIKNNQVPGGIIRKTFGGLEDLNNRVDAGTRILQFKVLKNKLMAEGVDPKKAYEAAMMASKDVHLNFAQKGASNGLNTLLQMIPLSRTYINAMDKSLRMGQYAPLTWAAGSAHIFLLYKAAQAWNSQFKDQDGIPFDRKVDPNLTKDMMPVYYGSKPNQYFPWHLGWVWGRSMPAWSKTFDYTMQYMGKAIPEVGGQSAENTIKQIPELQGRISGKQLFDAWSDWAFGIVTPESSLPPLAGVAVGLKQNQDNMGRAIVPQNLEDKSAPEFTKYYNSTDAALVDFTHALYTNYGIDLSPAKAEFVTRELSGTFGDTIMKAGAHLYSAMSGKNYPVPERGDIPGFKLFSGNTTDIPHEGIEAKYSNTYKAIQPVVEQEKVLKEQAINHPEVMPAYQKFVEEHATELYWDKRFADANKAINNIRKGYEAVIYADKDTLKGVQDVNPSMIGDQSKRDTLTHMKEQQIAIQKGLLQGIVDDLDKANTPTNDIWYERNERGMITKGIDKLLPSENPPKELDKKDKTSYNSPFDSKGTSMMSADMPPAITQAAPDDVQEQYKPGFLENWLPNITHGIKNMYKDNVINYTIKQEGGDKFTEIPGDRGGATKYGITLKTLQESNPKATSVDVKNLTAEQAKDIYQKNYWDRGHVDSMPIGVQDLVFDMNVNHGIGGSTIILQRALNSLGADIDEDGKLGNATLQAMSDFKTPDLRAAIIQERNTWVEDIAKNDPSQSKFLKGWKQRIAGLQQIPEEVKAEEA